MQHKKLLYIHGQRGEGFFFFKQSFPITLCMTVRRVFQVSPGFTISDHPKIKLCPKVVSAA